MNLIKCMKKRIHNPSTFFKFNLYPKSALDFVQTGSLAHVG